MLMAYVEVKLVLKKWSLVRKLRKRRGERK